MVTEDDMLRKIINESSEPVVGRLGIENMHSEGIWYKPRVGEVEMCPRVGRMGPISAVKLVDDLAGESPASANCPVGTVVITGDRAGDQTVGSPEVKALDGWMYSGQLRQGGASKAAGRSVSEP